MNVPILPITGKVPSNRLQRNKRTSRNVATAEPFIVYPRFTIQRPPSPLHRPTSKHPPSSEFFFEKFFCPIKRNIHHPPKFFSKFFFSENFSSYKMEHTPSSEIFSEKFLPLQEERYIPSIRNFSDDVQSLRFFFYKAK